jgi:hypothetical protein
MKTADGLSGMQELGRSTESCASAAALDSVVVVEVPDEHAGLSLINHLSRLHAELSPVDDARCAVRVELRERTLEALIDVFKRLRTWQSCVGVRTLRAHLGERVYTITPS